jgi:rhamnosyltransferase
MITGKGYRMPREGHLTTTAAVVVGFWPNLDVLARLLDSLSMQVGNLVLVDNGGSDQIFDYKVIDKDKIIYIKLNRNIGLGAALNIGIGAAIESGAEFIALFDQDSIPPLDLVTCLVASHRRLIEDNIDCAAIGPVSYDRRENERCYSVFFQEINEKISIIEAGSSTQRLIPVDTLITSGMVIKSSVWSNGYHFDEGFFVDLTDSEWSFRVRNGGHLLYADLDVELAHAQSDAAPARIFGLTFFRYTPIRRYYWCRNTIILLKSEFVSTAWKRRLTKALCLRLLANTLTDQKRFASLGMMLKGVWDGLLKKCGEYRGR